MRRKKVTESGEIIDEEVPEGVPEGSSDKPPEPLPSGLLSISDPPFNEAPSEPPKDYSFSNSGGVMVCSACQNTRHTDPVARKDLCSVADPSCPRSN